MINIEVLDNGSLIVVATSGRLFLAENDARDLFNELYDYFENKDREALARWLTNHKP